MEKFLEQTARYLLEKSNGDFSQTVIVFPNRRSGLFFQKYLSLLIDKPLFSPEITTISELVAEISGLNNDDDFSLIIELWKIYKTALKTEESLDDFYFKGEMILRDFNDIDKYLVDAGKLFKNIDSLKEIDYGFEFLNEEQLLYLSSFWSNIIKSKSSENKENFISLWSKLHEIYLTFRDLLLSQGISYEGMQYREMVARLADSPDIKYKNFALIGFNALNKCEYALFKHLKTNYNTSFFWDYDVYYLLKDFHEASLFLKFNLKEFPMPYDFVYNSDNFSKIEEMNVISVPGFSGQASIISKWYDEIQVAGNTRFDNSAIVLCDETLLLPLLNNFPSNIGELNITMGFPVRNHPVFGFIRSLIDVDKNSMKGSDNENVFFHRSVRMILNNSLIMSCLGHDFISAFIENIRKNAKIYLSNKDFKENEFLNLIFSLPEGIDEMKDYFRNILIWIFSSVDEEQSIVKEVIYQVNNSINSFFDSILKVAKNEVVSKQLIYHLLLRKLERLTIPFEGEPLKGMQIMGFLETRCLDFDNIILLSFNDDKLPGKASQNSIIPYSLRKGFGMPVSDQKNAMYSYYFYRLIQRAKNVTMVYDSRTDGLYRGEVSRYLNQLRYENKSLNINEYDAVFECNSSQELPISIKKSKKVINAVINYMTSKEISPTAFNAYITCKLKFYFRYIEDLRVEEDIEDDINNLLFGRIAHTTMEFLYQPFLGKEALESDFDRIMCNENLIDTTIKKAISKEIYRDKDFVLKGENILIFEIIKKYIVKIIEFDKNIAPIKFLGIEQKHYTDLKINKDGVVYKISVGGKIDRIDLVNSFIRIIDYKTGRSLNEIKDFENLFSEKNNNSACFQTMLYSFSYLKSTDCKQLIQPCVYGATSIFTKDFKPQFQFKNNDLTIQEYETEFLEGLENLISEIIDEQIPFSQVRDSRKCTYCEFNVICKR
jgi:CRISPR/Cas system-associated exonuclease Cas4 (RecB family)